MAAVSTTATMTTVIHHDAADHDADRWRGDAVPVYHVMAVLVVPVMRGDHGGDRHGGKLVTAIAAVIEHGGTLSPVAVMMVDDG